VIPFTNKSTSFEKVLQNGFDADVQIVLHPLQIYVSNYLVVSRSIGLFHNN